MLGWWVGGMCMGRSKECGDEERCKVERQCGGKKTKTTKGRLSFSAIGHGQLGIGQSFKLVGKTMKKALATKKSGSLCPQLHNKVSKDWVDL